MGARSSLLEQAVWYSPWPGGSIATGGNTDSPSFNIIHHGRRAVLILSVTGNTGGVTAQIVPLYDFPATPLTSKASPSFVPVVGFQYIYRFDFDALLDGRSFPAFFGWRLSLSGGTSIVQNTLFFLEGLQETPSGYPDPNFPGNQVLRPGLHYNRSNTGKLQKDSNGVDLVVMDVKG